MLGTRTIDRRHGRNDQASCSWLNSLSAQYATPHCRPKGKCALHHRIGAELDPQAFSVRSLILVRRDRLFRSLDADLFHVSEAAMKPSIDVSQIELNAPTSPFNANYERPYSAGHLGEIIVEEALDMKFGRKKFLVRG